MNFTVIMFILYLLVVLIIGLLTTRKTRTIHDFALGGNRLGPVVIAFSERASGESAWLIIGLPGFALVSGLLGLWTAIGCVTGIILSWVIVARPVRQLVGKYGALTLPELFSKRFQDENGSIRWFSSAIIVFFFTFYVAAQFSGAGKVLNVTFGITHMQGMLIGAFIIILYTILGGFLAVAWTDLVQGIIMIGTLVILPIVAWIELGQSGAGSKVLDWSTLFGGETGSAAVAGAIAGLSWGLGYLGQPHLIARFMAIDSSDNIRIGRWIASAWAIPAFLGSLLVGLIGRHLILNGLLLQGGQALATISELGDPEKLMPLMATNMFNPWIAGIMISGAIAAMMSTADSQLLVSTTVLTEDIVSRLRWARQRSFNLLTLGRLFTLVIGIVAFIMAWRSTNLVFELVSYAWSGLGAAFGPALVLTLWWKRTTKRGVLAGMITGAATTIIWANAAGLQQWMTERLVSFVLAFLAVIIFSLWETYQTK